MSSFETVAETGFLVRLNDFEGPFDLLLHLISKHKLEVTELALHVVTDDFIAYLKDQGSDWDLDETTEFLVVAATLLDLKSAMLLPNGEVEDEEDIAIFEARDLLFARLLQYRTYREVSTVFAAMIDAESGRYYRQARLPEPFASLMPELLFSVKPAQLAEIAQKVFAPKPAPPTVGLGHLHSPKVSVREQALVLLDKLKRRSSCSFRYLVQDADSTAVVVARFLALLEMFREKLVTFDQAEALGELQVRFHDSAAFNELEIEEFDSTDGEEDE
jgi:segregation and condensation protein A